MYKCYIVLILDIIMNIEYINIFIEMGLEEVSGYRKY